MIHRLVFDDIPYLACHYWFRALPAGVATSENRERVNLHARSVTKKHGSSYPPKRRIRFY